MILQNSQQAISILRQIVAATIAKAATDKGFIRLIGWFRFIALLLLTVRFAWGKNEVLGEVIPYALWAYFLSIVVFRLLADFAPIFFDTKAARFTQVAIDLFFVSLFYYASGDIKSDVFQLYILPLLIVARYANRLRDLIVFLTVVAFATFVIWLVLTNTSPQDFFPPHVWLLRLTSRVGFLGLFIVFYTVYQRRRRLVDDLQSAKQEILDKHHNTKPVTFTVDRKLCITGMDAQLEERYGANIIGKPYFRVFCPDAKQPARCPVYATIHGNRTFFRTKVMFADRGSGTFLAELSTTPILSKKKNIVGVVVTVVRLQEQEAFEELVRTYAANVEFAVDAANVDYESWAADKTHQLKAIAETTSAVLLPDRSLGIRRILQGMAELLRCQVSDLRLHRYENGLSGLVLDQAHGYDLGEGSEWRFVETDSTSIVALAFRQQKPIQVYDVQREPGIIKYIKKAKLYGLHSAAVFPLVASGRQIGTVSMYRQTRLEFSNDELELGQAFANSLAATLFSQQLVELSAAQAALQATQVTALSEISRQLSFQKDVATLAGLITSFTKVHLQAEVAALFLPKDNRLYRKAIDGLDRDWFQEEMYASGEGLTGQVMRDAQPILVNDVDTNEAVIYENLVRYNQALPSQQVKHLLAVPLVGKDGLIGVLRVLNKLNGDGQLSPSGFNKYDQDLLTIISHSIAVSIQSAYHAEEQKILSEQQKRRASNLLKLNNRTAEFTAKEDYRETLTHIALGLKDLLSCDIVGLGIYDRRTREIRALPDCGTVGVAPELIPQLRFAVELSGGKVLRSRKIYKTADTKVDPDSIFGKELPFLVGARAVLAVPLHVGERDVGILYAAQRQPRHFSSEEEQLCEIYARQAAVAIRNSELLNELNRRVAMLDNLREFSWHASEKDVLPEVLRIVAEVVNQALGADISFIAPFSTNENRLDIDLSVTAGNVGDYDHPSRISREGLSSKALDSTDGYFIVEDYSNHPPDFASDFVKANNITSAIAVRLEFKKDIVGILYVNFYNHHHFSEENIETLKLLGGHLAMTIHTFNLVRRNKEITKEHERERLREDMHSVLGSFHSRIMFAIERIHKQIKSSDRTDLLFALDRLWNSSRSIYRQMERILSDMRDPVLAERGLKVALEGLRSSYQDDLIIDLEFIGDSNLSPDVELALYRIAQECVHNVLKHAALKMDQDNSVLIRLDLESPIPRFVIQDYGQGFDVRQVQQAGTGLGLKVIANWARRIQAELDIKSRIGHGTTVCVSLLEKEAMITV
jgi:two-component system, NarL family, sensor kinase